MSYQKRVKLEKKELDEKLSNLHLFIYGRSEIYNNLDRKDRCLLKKQYKAMYMYSETLRKRIERF